MILNEEQLVSATRGQVDRETIDGYLYFYRFTKKQREYYAQTRFVGKERAAAGIVLEFITDATALSIDYRVEKGASQMNCFFDVYVDGLLTAHLGKDPYESPDESSLQLELTPGTKTVRIHFPHYCAVGLKNAELKDATVFHPTVPRGKYIAYGDSISQGYCSHYPSMSYFAELTRTFETDGYNLAVGGEVFQPEMIDPDYPVKADLVTVSYGSNDWANVTAETIRKNVPEFLGKIKQIHKGARILLLLPVWRGDGGETVLRTIGTLNDMRDFMRKTARELEIDCIEGEPLVPHDPYFYAPDLLHPNELGFSQFSKNLLKAIEAFRG